MIVAGIPAYNVEKTIQQVIEGAASHVDKVIVVDDGSKDMTAEISEKAGAIVVKHRKNHGIGPTRAAISKKAIEVNADVLVMLDGDGQHNPNDIPRVIEPVLKDEADICVGYRIVGKGHMPLYRRFGLWILNKAISFGAGEKIRDTQSGFIAFSRKAIEKIKFTEVGMAICVEFWYQVKRKRLVFQEVPIVINYKEVKGSTMNPFTHALAILNLLVKRVALRRPFLSLGLPGLIIFLVSSFFFGIVLNTYFTSRKLAVGLLISSGVGILLGSLLMLGAILIFVISDVLLRIERKIESYGN